MLREERRRMPRETRKTRDLGSHIMRMAAGWLAGWLALLYAFDITLSRTSVISCTFFSAGKTASFGFRKEPSNSKGLPSPDADSSRILANYKPFVTRFALFPHASPDCELQKTLSAEVGASVRPLRNFRLRVLAREHRSIEPKAFRFNRQAAVRVFYLPCRSRRRSESLRSP
jgi:hypothetical protein